MDGGTIRLAGDFDRLANRPCYARRAVCGVSFITAKSLLSPTRLFSWEAPFLGWPFAAARAIPSLILPPLVGILSQRLFAFFNR
jgi:uncharacterized membrane protein YraQ (UPF0718 family)